MAPRQAPQATNEKWQFGRHFLVVNFYMSWAGMALVMLAIMVGRDNSVLGEIFNTLALTLFGTLSLIVGGKGWKDFAQMKWGGKENAA